MVVQAGRSWSVMIRCLSLIVVHVVGDSFWRTYFVRLLYEYQTSIQICTNLENIQQNQLSTVPSMFKVVLIWCFRFSVWWNLFFWFERQKSNVSMTTRSFENSALKKHARKHVFWLTSMVIRGRINPIFKIIFERCSQQSCHSSLGQHAHGDVNWIELNNLRPQRSQPGLKGLKL